jgi:hypothetical protein
MPERPSTTCSQESGGNLVLVFYLRPPRRRLEDRIRELCGKAISAPDHKIGPVRELQVALREHNQRLRQIAAQRLGPDKLNRRSTDVIA